MDMKVMVDSVRNLAAVAGVVSGCQDRQRREERRNRVEYSRSARPTMLTTGSTWRGWHPNRALLTKLNSREWEDLVSRVKVLRRRYSRRVLVACRTMFRTLYCFAVMPSVSWF